VEEDPNSSSTKLKSKAVNNQFNPPITSRINVRYVKNFMVPPPLAGKYMKGLSSSLYVQKTVSFLNAGRMILQVSSCSAVCN
jgi:hypothetical protein